MSQALAWRRGGLSDEKNRYLFIIRCNRWSDFIERVGGGTLTAPNHVGRVNGFKEAMAQYPDIKIVFERPDNDDLQKAVDLTESALQAHPDLVGMFCCNASNPIGAARAIVNAGKVGQVHIAGMDDMPETLEFIKEGVIDVVKVQRQWEIGYWAIYYLVAMYQGHTVPQEHPTGSRFLTKEDL